MSNRSPIASIVVLAYNHLDLTKQCIESIYKYTAHLDFELITVNNGSDDGTKEYFESLPNKKKLNFDKNIGVCKAINQGFGLAEGKYILNVSNDIVVTTNWLDNLLFCMESDSSIGMVVPICNASCNYQQLTLPYTDIEDIQDFAISNNISNPNLWEERLKLCTYAGIYRGNIIKEINGFDEDFNPGSYDDDAICFRIRRMGYKVILARDCFVHHYGACTFNIEYEKDNHLLNRNKNLFFSKFLVDPYVSGLIDYHVLDVLDINKCNEVNILGVGSSYGTTVLQLKNLCKQKNCEHVHLYYLSEIDYNLIDLKTICDECVRGSISNIMNYFTDKLFDFIIVESDSSMITNKEEAFKCIISRLKSGGQVVCTAASEDAFYDIINIFTQLGLSFRKQINNYYLCFIKI